MGGVRDGGGGQETDDWQRSNQGFWIRTWSHNRLNIRRQ